MSIKVSPPPLSVPAEFLTSKGVSAFFSGLLNTIYQLWTSVYSIRTSAKLKTTDATPTAVIRVQIPTNKTMMLQAFIVARRTGGSAGTVGDSAWYVITGAYKNIGGTLTGIGSADIIGGEDQAAWSIGLSASGDNAAVAVQGAANNDITWEVTLSTYEVGA